MIITNSSPDDFYFNQLLAFLMSVKINSPKHKVNVFLANYPTKKENKLKEIFKDFIFENRKLKMIDKRGFSFIQFRAQLVKECFQNYHESVAWVDTDVIVRSDLSEFLQVNPKQLKILYRGKTTPERVRINAGIFNIGCSNETYDFICDWQRRIEMNAKWGMGQLEFWKAYKAHKDKIELVKMNKKFNDLGGYDRPNAFSNDSVVWHCKKAHFKNKKFQKDYQYYLDLGKELYYV
jgi:hypothetical protein